MMRNNFPLRCLALACFTLMAWVSVQAQTMVCPGVPTYLTLGPHRGFVQWQSSTDGGLTWTSMPGANNDTVAVTVTGSTLYRAAITEGTCAPLYSDTSNLMVTDLLAHAGPNGTTCSGPVTIGGNPSATGGTPPYTYLWSPSTGLSVTNVANPVASPTVPTTYILTVTDMAGCASMDTMLVDTGSGGSPGLDSTEFLYTGSMATFTVPPCTDTILIKAWGAQGGNPQDRLPTNSTGGLGGYATGKLLVTPGQVLNIYVGGVGSASGPGGYNGGGAGGTGSPGGSCFGGPAAGGGGASDVRVGGTALSNRVIVAGGGGGAGRDYCNGTCQPCGCGGGGGGAGGVTGTNGAAAYNCGFSYPGTGTNFGGGGTQSAGGAAGPQDAGGTNVGFVGALGQGGNGSNGQYDVAGGGGGGGYYGGGGGGGASNGSGVGGGGGGGGSSYITGLSNASTVTGVRSGNGRIVIYY